ncbi:NADPH-dependent FMN reductase [Sphingomonas sp. Leaf407]|uniref:NADPH-dependent FMN reductase n=1 Tax=unclassified Sphingomonas TaxID=196159 RepID=UPI0006F2A966|nr:MULTISPECIES: NADPH-dependent FMN reductase [unclassified Sphingomonas]KQN40887.1 NADPH-dependent FMN reductase [Sphingomonas sp. Leaf42]KQT30239.1 NADPH-dependent FMN reductase [Sphingomonas sp. Leaf407]
MARHIIGIGGTFRPRSSSEMLVRAVLGDCAALGARTTMFDGPALAALPHFNPERPERTAEQAAFVAALRDADALVIGTPGYHGGVSGVVKNAIDLLEDLRGDERVYFDGMPVGLIVSAAGWQAGGVTLAALRGIVHAMRGWPTPAGIAINSIAQKPFGGDGAIVDPSIAGQIATMARQIMAFRLEPVA